MGFLKKAIDFAARPTHSRTMGLVVMLVLVAAVSLTVIVAQQQQQIKQRAAGNSSCTVTPRWDSAKLTGKPYRLSFESGPKFLDTVDGINDTFYTFNNVDPGAYTFQISSGRNFIKVTAVADCVSIAPAPVVAFDCSGAKNALEYGCYSSSNLPSNDWFPIEKTTKTNCESNNQVCYARIPSASSSTTSTTPTPTSASAISCLFLNNIGSCIADKNCAWGKKLTDTTASCLSFGSKFQCPTGFDQWYWQDYKTNECASASGVTPAISSAPTKTPTPTSTKTPTPTQIPPTPVNFQCLDQAVGSPYAGIYRCAPVINNFVNCPSGYSEYFPGAITSCNASDQRCCKQLPTSTATPTPTSTPASVTLVMSINAQDTPIVSGYLSVNLALYNLTTNLPVTGAPGTQSFTLTPIPGKQYSANIPLLNLGQGKYFIVARKGNMIAKSIFTVSSANERITVPTTTLVFGDLNNDNDINILDHDNIFKGCWKKEAKGSCVSTDFDKNGEIDQIDYNTWLRGFATWNKQGKNL